MALPHVLVLGETFIRRLRQFVLGPSQHFSVAFSPSRIVLLSNGTVLGAALLSKRFNKIYMLLSALNL